jgi:hypothetical protein
MTAKELAKQILDWIERTKQEIAIALVAFVVLIFMALYTLLYVCVSLLHWSSRKRI